ncbi:bifunctional N-glycosylase/AP lyase [Starmerella bacillaris]|uniref:Endonuclease III homolog n=1 Tax=Starmerella bacillaris TaxID=1247836 RepID=A0AAV5RI04_STABA|nr:bifunctional N-glycosylase/AP lyase [Starmerella bacillaris]
METSKLVPKRRIRACRLRNNGNIYNETSFEQDEDNEEVRSKPMPKSGSSTLPPAKKVKQEEKNNRKKNGTRIAEANIANDIKIEDLNTLDMLTNNDNNNNVLSNSIEDKLSFESSNDNFKKETIEESQENVLVKLEPKLELALNAIDSPEYKDPNITDIEDMGPPNWMYFLEKVREMRALHVAPVDSVGCAQLGQSSNSSDPKDIRFNHLVALMLSAQTRDEITAGAISRLRKLPNDLNVESIISSDEETIAKTIYPVGFFRRKAKFIKLTAEILKNQYNSDIPRSIEDITSLPGVGPKMGYLLLQTAWNDVQGIGVDVHVHRLSTLWKWVPPNGTPEKTRKNLESWLPRELWADINPLLVGFGQTWCPPRPSKKACEKCLLRKQCPASLAKR